MTRAGGAHGADAGQSCDGAGATGNTEVARPWNGSAGAGSPDVDPGMLRSSADSGPALGDVDGTDPWVADGASLALYVHLPWCVRKCPYCDFNSHRLTAPHPDAGYIDALLLDFETELPLIGGRRVDTVFFGGGTPSLFPPEAFARLLRSLRQRIEFAQDVEITLEANPGTIERGRFAGYRDAGINRVSLGAQTFAPRALERLGRIHSAEDTHTAVAELRAAGIGNFNLDLMYSLPEQTLEDAVVDVQTACALGPTHLSHYQLTLEPGTVFHARPPALPDDEAAWHIQTECQRLLAAAGYAQYEVSAYARAGFQCRHNLNYWRFGDYVGLGAGAHGKLSLALPERILRTAKPKQPRDYQDMVVRAAVHRRPVAQIAQGTGSAADGRMDSSSGAGGTTSLGPFVDSGGGRGLSGGVGSWGDVRLGDAIGSGNYPDLRGGIGERRYIPSRELAFEFMLNALRLNEGFSNRGFESRTGLSTEAFDPAMRESLRRGLIQPTDVGWRPTELGRRFLNDLQTAFLE